jgi:hypothetical protein
MFSAIAIFIILCSALVLPSVVCSKKSDSAAVVSSRKAVHKEDTEKTHDEEEPDSVEGDE